MSNGADTIIASVIGVFGLFSYGGIAFVMKRFIDQLDNMTKAITGMHDRLINLELSVKFLENKSKPNLLTEENGD